MNNTSSRRTSYYSVLFLGAVLVACVHSKNLETATPGVDPYAPAVPELTTTDSSRSEQNEPTAATRVGSEDPVIVDSMTSQGETPSQATQDYIDAFNDRPDYKPAATQPDSPKKESVEETGSAVAEGDGSRKMIVNIQRINIRSKPNRFSKIVGELRKGDVIMVDIDQSIGWGKISEGRYIRARHLKSAKE